MDLVHRILIWLDRFDKSVNKVYTKTMKRIYLGWQDIENHTQEILRKIHHDAWRPDYVVGLTRGGLIPAIKFAPRQP